LFQSHFILGIKLEKGRGHGGEFQALFDYLQRNEGAELIDRVKAARCMISASESSLARMVELAPRTM